MRVRSLGREDPLEKEMATHSSILAWRIPWTEEPEGLQPMGFQRVGHEWGIDTHMELSRISSFTFMSDSPNFCWCQLFRWREAVHGISKSRTQLSDWACMQVAETSPTEMLCFCTTILPSWWVVSALEHPHLNLVSSSGLRTLSWRTVPWGVVPKPFHAGVLPAPGGCPQVALAVIWPNSWCHLPCPEGKDPGIFPQHHATRLLSPWGDSKTWVSSWAWLQAPSL